MSNPGHSTILGPNGAGKSTLLKLLSREAYPLEQPDSVLRLFGSTRFNVWDLRKQRALYPRICKKITHLTPWPLK